MNKRDAIKAMLDGEKVKYKNSKTDYIYMDMNGDILTAEGIEYDLWECSNSGFKIYKEPVKVVKDYYYIEGEDI